MLIIGITGQSGSGKGYLSAAFKKLGYVHADADAIYHDLLEKSGELRAELVRAFGNDIEHDGKIDRGALGAKVFGKKNARKLLKLNKIAHKYVCREYVQRIIKAKEDGEKGFIIDAPLLIEARLHKLCDACVCVAASTDVRVRRIMERDGIGEDAARLRIDSQKPLEFYARTCEYIFLNEGGEDANAFAANIDKILTEDFDE